MVQQALEYIIHDLFIGYKVFFTWFLVIIYYGNVCLTRCFFHSKISAIESKTKMLILEIMYIVLLSVCFGWTLLLSSKTESTSMDSISRESNKNSTRNIQKILSWSDWNVFSPPGMVLLDLFCRPMFWAYHLSILEASSHLDWWVWIQSMIWYQSLTLQTQWDLLIRQHGPEKVISSLIKIWKKKNSFILHEACHVSPIILDGFTNLINERMQFGVLVKTIPLRKILCRSPYQILSPPFWYICQIFKKGWYFSFIKSTASMDSSLRCTISHPEYSQSAWQMNYCWS